MYSYETLDNKFSSLLFHPRKTTKTTPDDSFLDLDIEVDTSVSLGCRMYISSKSSPTIFYFHGNGETVCDYDTIASLYRSSGFNLLVFTYRGYGWSTGIPSVTNLMSDAIKVTRHALQYLRANDYDESVFIMGRSLGSSAAIECCANDSDSYTGIIIESGFADTLPLLLNLGADTAAEDLHEKDGFNNRQKIESITIPTLILHGSLDQIIHIPQAERLQAFSGARTKKFFVIPGADHNTMIAVGGERYFTTILDFVNEVTGAATWRERRKKFKESNQR